MNRILLILIFSSFYFSAATQPPVTSADSVQHAQKKNVADNSSASIQPDSSLQVNDLKKGFKNLYLASPEIPGIQTAELNPRAVSFVQDYMGRHRKNLEKLKDWGRPYFDLMDAILTLHGLPRELKYLAVIESHLKTYAVSWAGAVGPWQFMPSTARRFGLRVTGNMDERTDYYKSTHAAARYLSELYSIFNDWLLVIAAYNGGPGNVQSAMRRSKSDDFWELQYYLPAESREHVKKFIATHYIMEGDGGVTTLTKDETKNLLESAVTNPAEKYLTREEIENSKLENVSGKYNSVVIARHTLIPVTEFNRYNPGFDKLLAANGSYELRLPADKMELFKAKRYLILDESIKLLLDEFRQALALPVKN